MCLAKLNRGCGIYPKRERKTTTQTDDKELYGGCKLEQVVATVATDAHNS